MARSSQRFQVAIKDNDDDKLRLSLIRLAKQYGRYGYRKITELLKIEGWKVNHKKVERLWKEEGLQLPQRHKKRKRLYHKDSSIIRLRPKYQNHIWSIDFVHDRLSNSRQYKMLTVLDEYTREALCVAMKPRMGNAEVLEALYPLILSTASLNISALTTVLSSSLKPSRDGSPRSASSQSVSIQDHHGKMVITNASMAHYGMKF